MTPLPVAILAGGLGTRLHPITQTVPTALVEICGEPFLAHQLRLLSSQGIRRVVLCVGHYGEQIRHYTGDGRQFGLEVVFSWDGPVLRGTAGALRHALPLLGDEFFVMYGDSYLSCSYVQVAGAFQHAGLPALMTVFRNAGNWDRSNVEFAGGRILAYDKKNPTPRMEFIDYGLGVFHRSAFSGGHADLAELYQDLLRSGQLAAVEVCERFYEIGSFEGITDLTEYLSRRTE